MGEIIITIFGTGRANSGDSAYTLAYETGRLLAEADFVIANGGYGGTMTAAAKGAAEAGTNISVARLSPVRWRNGSIN
ncbi:MAG: SLOG cluster 4 domain-containing protein [Planctomycetota bacterium]|jgi:uncharacterized protein (TIGR00725 family)